MPRSEDARIARIPAASCTDVKARLSCAHWRAVSRGPPCVAFAVPHACALGWQSSAPSALRDGASAVTGARPRGHDTHIEPSLPPRVDIEARVGRHRSGSASVQLWVAGAYPVACWASSFMDEGRKRCKRLHQLTLVARPCGQRPSEHQRPALELVAEDLGRGRASGSRLR